MKRRRFLGVLACSVGSACVAETPAEEADAGACSTPSADASGLYCLVEGVVARIAGAASLAVGQAVVFNVDDNTAVIVGRDDAGFFARSAVCTHACCVVTLCDDEACTVLGATPKACGESEAALGGLALCPCHGSIFRLSDGVPLTGPATRSLPAYPVQLEGDDVLVDTGALGAPGDRVQK